MTHSEAYSLARKLMDQHGLQSWTFKFNRRKRSFGLCSYTRKVIQLSKYHAEMGTPEDIKDTILHEIAHALAFSKYGRSISPHGYEWRSIAISIGSTGERCGTGDMPAVNRKHIWIATCQDCKKEYRVKRAGRRKRMYSTCWCKGSLIWIRHKVIPAPVSNLATIINKEQKAVASNISQTNAIAASSVSNKTPEQQRLDVLRKLSVRERVLWGLPANI